MLLLSTSVACYMISELYESRLYKGDVLMSLALIKHKSSGHLRDNLKLDNNVGEFYIFIHPMTQYLALNSSVSDKSTQNKSCQNNSMVIIVIN